MARMAVAAGGAAGLGAGLDGQPALRVEPGRRDDRLPDDRDRRRGRRPDRRGRVDDPGAVGAAQARPAVPGRQRDRRCPPRWAGGWSTRRMPAGVDGLARRGQRAAARALRHLPGAAGRVRRCARTSWPTRPGTTASTTTWSSPCPAPSSARDESIRPGQHARDAGGAEAVVPPGRDDHRRQRLPAQRRRLRGAARLGRPPPTRSAATRWRGSPAAARTRAGAAGLRLRARSRRRTGRWPGPASAGPTSARSSSTRRSPCSRSPASTPGRSTRTSSTPAAARSPSGTRSARPAAAILGTLATAPARASGHRWGVAAICIGVGQGLAVVLENATMPR